MNLVEAKGKKINSIERRKKRRKKGDERERESRQGSIEARVHTYTADLCLFLQEFSLSSFL